MGIRFGTVLALLAFAILAGFLLTGCGLLVCRFVLPRRLAPLKLPASPVIGAAFVSLLAQWLSTLGLAVGVTAWLYLVLAGIGWTTTTRRPAWRALMPLLVGALAFLAATLPIVRLGYLTAVSGNIDAISYVTRAEYLADHPSGVPGDSEGPPKLVAAHAPLRIVDTLLLALFSHLLDRRAFELLTPLGGLFLACAALGTWAWARLGLRLRQGGALLAAALVGVANLLLWVVFDSFQSQAFALGLAPLTLAFLAHGVRRPDTRSAALFGLLAAALISAYVAYGLWLVATTAALLGVRLIRRGRLRPAIGWAVVAMAVALVSGWPGLAKAAGELKIVSGILGRAALTAEGNIHVYPPIGELLGLFPHAAAALGTEPPLWRSVTAVATVVGIALVLFGFWSLPARRRWIALFPLLAATAMAVHQRFLLSPPSGFPYGYFKLATLLALCVVPLAVAGVIRLSRGARTRYVGWAALLLLVGLNLVHSAWTIRLATHYRVVPTSALLDLAAIRDIEPGGWISVDVQPGLLQNWIIYLLSDYRLHFPGGVLMYPGTNRTPPAPPRLALLQPARAATLDTADGTYRVLWHNSDYELRELTDPAAAPIASLAGSPQPIQANESFVVQAKEKVFSVSSPANSGHLGIPADARRMQATLLVLADDKLLLPDDGARPLARGVWTLDADLSCLRSGLTLRLAGGRPLGISQWVALRAAPEQPPGCFRIAPSPEGFATVNWRPTGRDRVRFDIYLQRPATAVVRNYRFDMWVRPAGGGDPWAVWYLGLTGKASRASLEVDLKNRSHAAELEEKDVVAQVDLGREQAGTFDSQLAWWDLQTKTLVAVFKGPRFVRDDEGHIRSLEPAVATRAAAVQVPVP